MSLDPSGLTEFLGSGGLTGFLGSGGLTGFLVSGSNETLCTLTLCSLDRVSPSSKIDFLGCERFQRSFQLGCNRVWFFGFIGILGLQPF